MRKTKDGVVRRASSWFVLVFMKFLSWIMEPAIEYRLYYVCVSAKHYYTDNKLKKVSLSKNRSAKIWNVDKFLSTIVLNIVLSIFQYRKRKSEIEI